MYRDQGLTQSSYAKWGLPLVLLLLGVTLISIFFPATKFIQDPKNEDVIYYVTENKIYVDIETRDCFEIKNVGGEEKLVEIGIIYNKKLPNFNETLFNLSGIAIASGISFCALGIFMYVVNLVKKASSSAKKDHDEE